MRSNMMHSFSDTPQINAPRSKFDRSFKHKTTLDAGWLVPFYWDEVLPGDTFSVRTDVFLRMNTLLFPLMDNIYADIQYFSVPYRQLMDNWRKLCGEQIDPGDSIAFSIPILSGTRNSDADADLTTAAGRTGALLNYMGVPHGIDATDVDIGVFPFRAYNHIYDQWYRDQNLIDSVTFKTDDTADPDTGFELLRRGKRHDYFTSALPWPQKGSAATLPLGTTAPIEIVTGLGNPGKLKVASSDLPYAGGPEDLRVNLASSLTSTAGPVDLYYDPNSTLQTDLTGATSFTVNALREFFQVQKLLERDARSGTRYPEVIQNHFGVTFDDITYRPEYLGGGSFKVNVNTVVQTGRTVNPADGLIGDLTAFGTVTGDASFTKSFNEWGLVMGIISIRADLTYQQGLNRFFSHRTRYDKYWPSLAHLGEQAILSKEIYVDGTANDEDVFGYQERYAEYRYKPSMITGKFQSGSASSLDPWHLSQEFAARPTLSQTFIEEDPPIDRVIGTPAEPHFIMDSLTTAIAARPIPVFGVPGLIDHF